MVLLPETEYDQLKQCNADKTATAPPLWPTASSTEREQKLYALSLAKRRNIPSPTSDSAPPESGKKAYSFGGEVSLFPKAFRVRAERLHNTLEKHRPDLVSWNQMGELIFDRHGFPLSGSNLVDLIQHATTTKRRPNFTPIGWTKFITLLKRINVPLSLLNKETGAEWDQAAAAMPPVIFGETLETAAERSAAPPPRKRKRVLAGSTPLARRSWIRA